MRILQTGSINFRKLIRQIPAGAIVYVTEIAREYMHMGDGRLRLLGTEQDLTPEAAIGGHSWYASDEILKALV